MSARWSARRESSACSGAMKSTVPMYIPLSVNRAARCLAKWIGRVDDAGQPEVEDADRSGVVEHEVAGLDIAVDDSLGMGGLEPAGGLDDAVDRLRHGHRPAVADDAIEVAAFDVFHHQEMHAAIFVGIDGGHDVGMFQPAGGLDFAAESHDRLSVAGEGRRKDLESADAAQPAVAALEDHAHAALADLVEDDVVSDQEPAALLLIDGGGLIGRQLPGLDQSAREPHDALRCRRRPVTGALRRR